MVNTRMFEFKHPKYYTELRKRNKSDQAISLKAHDGECERASWSGPHEIASIKLQASSVKLSNQPVRLTSGKHPNHNHKRQATSLK